MKRLLAIVLTGFTALGAHAAQRGLNEAMPKDARDTADIVKVAEARDCSGLKRTPQVQRATLADSGRTLFAVWYCPFSGEDAAYVHAYYFDPIQERWKLFVDQLVRHHAPTVELLEGADALIVKNLKGEVLLKESIATVPKKK